MLCQFIYSTLDPQLHECLEGLSGLVTKYIMELSDSEYGPYYLIGATGLAENQAAWTNRCQAAIFAAEVLADRVEWMVENLRK